MDNYQKVIYDRIKNLLIDQFQVNEELISWETEVMSTLGLSLMQYAELTIELEKLFDVSLSSSNLLHFSTIGQLVNYLSQHGKPEFG